jgi:hypothetical protein
MLIWRNNLLDQMSYKGVNGACLMIIRNIVCNKIKHMVHLMLIWSNIKNFPKITLISFKNSIYFWIQKQKCSKIWEKFISAQFRISRRYFFKWQKIFSSILKCWMNIQKIHLHFTTKEAFSNFCILYKRLLM